jgi:hypothetical protein
VSGVVSILLPCAKVTNFKQLLTCVWYYGSYLLENSWELRMWTGPKWPWIESDVWLFMNTMTILCSRGLVIRWASVSFLTDSLLWSNLTKTTKNTKELWTDFLHPVFPVHPLIFLHTCWHYAPGFNYGGSDQVQILFVLNLLDISIKFCSVAIFVTADLKIFNLYNAYLWVYFPNQILLA